MNYTLIPPDRYNDVIEHLRYTFFADEPLNKAVQLCKQGEGHYELEKHSLCALQDGLSVMAVCPETKKIFGVSLNGILQDGDIEKSIESLNLNNDERSKKIFQLLYEENMKLNLLQRFHVDRIFEIRILSVDEKCRGQGIGRKLLEKSEEIAIENGFEIMKTDATGLFSYKISKSLGYKTISELCYADYLDKNGVPIFNVEPPHEKLVIMYKSLRNIDDNHSSRNGHI